jgi:arabinogalactan endo-1,4-beta-galactosidase
MKRPFKHFAILLIATNLLSCHKNQDPPTPTPPAAVVFLRGADLSFTPEINQSGFVFTDNGSQKPMLSILKSYGINTIRVRLWNNPANAHSGLQEVMQFGKEIKAAGLQFWLDFHYSDTWADPGHQTKPAAWAQLSFQGLQDSLYGYTSQTLNILKQNQATPDFIEIGNEINDGLLWDDGKASKFSDAHWSNLITLLGQASKGCRNAAPGAKIIVHYAGFSGAEDFFNGMWLSHVNFDIIGLSYYPWWHGNSLANLGQTVQTLHNAYNKPVLIVETAYPWTLQWNDQTNNSVGTSDQITPGYDATPDGQSKFLTDLTSLIHTSSNQTGSGVCYWAPDWVAFKGKTATDGSSWENLALFDFQGNALPAISALGK